MNPLLVPPNSPPDPHKKNGEKITLKSGWLAGPTGSLAPHC